MGTRQLCLVFDLDDTLFLERDYVRSGFNAVGQWAATHLGIPAFGDCAWRLFQTGLRSRVFDVALKESGNDPSPALIQEMVTVYRSHTPQISVLPDALECLSFFHGNVELAMVTDGPLISQRRKCQALGLDSMFDVIVFTDEMGDGFSKPHRRAFEYVQSRTKPHAERFVYIGDNPNKDFIAPLALGWDTVRVRRPEGLYYSMEAAIGAAAEVEIRDLSSLKRFVTCTKLSPRPSDA